MSGSVPAFRLAGGGGGSKKPIYELHETRKRMIGFSPCDFARDASHENDVSEVGGVFSFAIKPIWKFGTLG